jgi:hypothetical protein
VRIELVSKGIPAANQNLPAGERLIFFKVRLFISVYEPHVFLKRQPSVLEAEASGTLFSCEN